MRKPTLGSAHINILRSIQSYHRALANSEFPPLIAAGFVEDRLYGPSGISICPRLTRKGQEELRRAQAAESHQKMLDQINHNTK